MDDDPGTATHTDNDGDLWRITPSSADLWSNHQHRWIEARTILDLTHRADGALTPLTPSRTHPRPRRTP